MSHRSGTQLGVLSVGMLGAALLLGCSEAPETPETAGNGASRLLVLGLDGFDPDVVETLIAEGRLPTLQRLGEEGAAGRLRSATPLLSPILWTTIATGREPLDHGVTAFTVTGAEGEELPVTSLERKTRALWSIWSAHDRSVGVVGWWATWPAEAINGAIVSDRVGYHFLQAKHAEGDVDLPGATFPASVAAEIATDLQSPDALSFEDIAPFATVTREEFSHPFEFGHDLSHLKWAVATARSYRDIGLRLWREKEPDALLVYFEGADTVSHLFGHLYRRRDLAGELLEQQRRYGQTVEAMYEFLDGVVAEFLAAVDNETTVVIVSDHGFELGALPVDPSKTRDLRRVSHESHRLDGVIFMGGRGVVAGHRIEGAGILDVAPTLLALSGLPASAEMPGRLLAEALTLGPELDRVATYETGESPASDSAASQATAADLDVDEAVLEKLRSLGYLDNSDGRDAGLRRNEASLALRAGRFREAARGFHALQEEHPEDATLAASLASALLGLGRHEEALASCAQALELDPAYVPAYYVCGQAYEASGDRAAAVEAYRTAAKYAPEHAPTAAALARLGEPLEARVAETDDEVRAALLLREAKDAMERGDYDAGMRAVDKVEALVPNEAIVFQYRSNLCYLIGDLERAIGALERGLELEPGNALMRKNLGVLRRKSG